MSSNLAEEYQQKATEGVNASKTGPTAFGLLLQESHDPTFQRFEERCQDPPKEAEEIDSQKSDTEKQKPENYVPSVMLMLIQKLISKNRRGGVFVCKVESQPGNPIVDETKTLRKTPRDIFAFQTLKNPVKRPYLD